MPGLGGQAQDAAAARLRASIAELWVQARPRALERVAVIEDAIADLLGGALADDRREAARGEAHKLAGALASFGIEGVTEHAQALERAFDGMPGIRDVPRLSEHALALRRAVEQDPRDGAPDPGGARVVLAGLTEARGRALAGAAAPRGWRVQIAPVAPAAGEADVVLLGPGTGDVKAAVAELARAGAAVAVTDDAGDRVELVRAGARRLLPASLDPAGTVAELADLEAGHRAAEATVLAVDDDPIVLALLEAALTRHGHRFRGLGDPDGFWAALEDTRPDLVVLDVQLPGIDGTELCRALRADPRWRALPVLFLTATADGAAIGELFAAGGDDYVPKPVDGRQVAARIAGRLERTRQLRADARIDERTGLLRRGAAERALERHLAVARRLRQPLAVAALRVDGLAERSDREVAVTAAGTALRHALGGADVAARWDGDALVVGMLGLDAHDARGRLGELLEGVRNGGTEPPLTLSAGVAELPRDGTGVDELVTAALDAVGAAAAAGGDRVARTAAMEEDVVDIALVEDDEVLARLVLHALDTRGYRVRWIDDGAEAVKLLGGEQPPLRAALVLLDWDLPGRDGLTVLRLLGADGVLEGTRVIMLTMRASEREVLATLELGATDHVAKPFSVAVLMQRVRRVLAR